MCWATAFAGSGQGKGRLGSQLALVVQISLNLGMHDLLAQSHIQSSAQ